MQRCALMFGVSLAVFGITGCEKKPETVTTIRVVESQPQAIPRTSTFETREVRDAIDRYVAVPAAETAAAVQKSFAELDLEIAELQEDVVKETDPEDKAEAEVKRRDLVAFREAERIRFADAQARAAVGVGELPTRDVGHEIKKDARDAGHEIKEELKDTGEKIKDTLKEVVR